MEARLPQEKWRIYSFFDDGTEGSLWRPLSHAETHHIHRKMRYFVGKDHRVADIHIDHDSISRQHAVLVYRTKKGVNGADVVLPYVLDLESRNGTYLNGDKIEPHRYYEIRDGDALSFGAPRTRYVFLNTKEVIRDNPDGN